MYRGEDDVQYKDQVRPSVVVDSASSTLTADNKHDVAAEPSIQPIVFTIAEILPDQNTSSTTTDVNVAQLLQENDRLQRFDSAYHEDNTPAWRSSTGSTRRKQRSRCVQLRLGLTALLVLALVICISSTVTVVVLVIQNKQLRTPGTSATATNGTVDGNTSRVPEEEEEEEDTTEDDILCAGYSIATTTEITVLPSWQPLPFCLQTLTNLQKLIVRTNNLWGTLPTELGLLTQLQVIDFTENALSGTIPWSHLLPALTDLHTLRLELNQLTGTAFPSQMGTSLTHLRLPDNQLSGTIPDSIAELQNMEYSHVQNNQLTGTLPTEIGARWTQLKQFSVGLNELRGSLPIEFGRWTLLSGLWMYQNNFTGPLPDEEWAPMSPTLSRLEVNHNLLTGTVPTWVDSVEYLNVGNNLFVEEIVLAVP